MKVSIRNFQEHDIPYKVKWINDEENNKYLHYDLPLRVDKTLHWYRGLKNRTDRLDLTITCNDEPAGLIGLLNIDFKNKKAEYYICIGEKKFKGKGVASEATKLLFEKAYRELNLNRIYLYTEKDNIRAQKFFEKIGFEKEGLLKSDLIYNGREIDRYIYGLILNQYNLKLKVKSKSEYRKSEYNANTQTK